MILLPLVGLVLAAPPQSVQIVTPRGTASVPVTTERGVAAIAFPRLAGSLRASVVLQGVQATVDLDGTAFAFTLGVPFVRAGGTVYVLAGEPYVARDTLFLPLVWLAETVPRVLAPRYRWDAAAARLEEAAPPVVMAPPLTPPVTASPPAAPLTPSAPHPITGLRRPHTVAIDPGHGGRDPGNPGRFFPRGVTEKDVNLAIGRLLRAELVRRGLEVILIRSTDTLIDYADRGASCSAACDLFVSIHVNAMPDGRRQRQVNGIETYFLSEAKTEDQRRVARMENEAIRFETDVPPASDVIGIILRSLQDNEYLRESARLADLVQRKLAVVHPGDDRGVQQAGFIVLSLARRPAVLVETGFATNKDDAAFLTSALGQRKIANAIADGIVAYLLEFERKVTLGGGGGAAR
ncbi:MAG: N-acetylmuramoyl-L-alanine amidase [Gemmatimonadetes bacterium]|nr:N-acetylmuramoyl-L-alanine amidase [Gemmatimonadota bacterium]